MVNEITPTYYARPGATGLFPFNVKGVNLGLIPDDAVAILATKNEEPLERLYAQQLWFYQEIKTRDDNSIEFGYDSDHALEAAFYLGAIVSADRTQIFWVNNTQPLP